MTDLAQQFHRTADSNATLTWAIARKIIASISAFLKARHDMRLLASMSDAQLKDIGISRSEIETVVHTGQNSRIDRIK
jgi:uncharacterized protein YjiS (DUF1127 family)